MSARSQEEPQRKRPRGLFARLKKFNTKFLLVTGLSVVIGAILNIVVARQGIHTLSQKSAFEIEGGLNTANREYITNHLADKAQQTNFILGQAYADLQIFADIYQEMIDHDGDMRPLLDQAAQLPYFRDRLVYHPPSGEKGNEKGNWYQNESDEPTGVAVWGYNGDKGTIKSDALKAVEDTAILDIILPSFKRHGSEKLQIYVVGPKEVPFVRVAPYADMGTNFDKYYPGHNEKNWYDFFFPNLVESWQTWIKNPDTLKTLPSKVTVLPPYLDSAGGGIVLTAFHPIWSKDRKEFAGAAAIDLTLAQLINSIKDVRLAQTGFAFLAQSDGNVLAVNDAGAETLQLSAESGGGKGVDVLQRYLKKSKSPEVREMVLPQDDKIDYHEITIAGETYIIALERLARVSTWMDARGIVPDQWTLGFVVPKKEMYASLVAAQSAIEQSRTSIVWSQALITLALLVVLMVGVYLVSRRMTGALVELSSGATRMREGDYSVRIDVQSEDEIGQLGVAFNEMASEIQAYTNNLEELVSERTRALEKANQEISELNAKLAQENIRLGAELNVARQLQLMVLPAPQELEQITELDIAGYMAPADEVGGDYYDVLRNEGLVKIGIGDVTGHGLESGVLMLMVQTAVRTLLATGEQDPTRFLSIVNKVIYQNIQRINSTKNMSLTLLDYSGGTIKLTGQHEDLIIVRKDGSLERFDTMGLGMPIGLDPDIEDFISSAEIKMEPGDLVALFSDGITEAEDASSQQYGIDRLCEVIKKNHERSSKEIKDAIIEDVLAHIGYNKVYDDITVLVIKRV